MKGTVEERFWAKVDKFGPVLVRRLGRCWVWTASTNQDGYGLIRNEKGKLSVASRISWELVYSKIPDSLYVLHRCDNPECVRPTHLFLGTNRDNSQDMIKKGRSNFPSGDRHGFRIHPESIPIGEMNGRAKAVSQTVIAIRKRYKEDGWTQKDLAQEFGLSRSNIGRIVRFETWGHVQ